MADQPTKKARKPSPASVEKQQARQAYRDHFGKEPPKRYTRYNMTGDIRRDKIAKGIIPRPPPPQYPTYRMPDMPRPAMSPIPNLGNHSSGPHEVPSLGARVGNVLSTIHENRGKIGLAAAGVAAAGAAVNGGSTKDIATAAAPGVVAAAGHHVGGALNAAGRAMTGVAGELWASQSLTGLFAGELIGGPLGVILQAPMWAGAAAGIPGWGLRAAGTALKAASHVAMPLAVGMAAYQVASKAHAEGLQAGFKEAGKQALSIGTLGMSDLAFAAHSHIQAKRAASFDAANKHYTDQHMQDHHSTASERSKFWGANSATGRSNRGLAPIDGTG